LEYKYLPKQTLQEGETSESFAKRVQMLIAKELGVPATNFTSKSKNALRVGWNPYL
jgi:hypothetical protein